MKKNMNRKMVGRRICVVLVNVFFTNKAADILQVVTKCQQYIHLIGSWMTILLFKFVDNMTSVCGHHYSSISSFQ